MLVFSIWSPPSKLDAADLARRGSGDVADKRYLILAAQRDAQKEEPETEISTHTALWLRSATPPAARGACASW